jgi:hypothetical protein
MASHQYLIRPVEHGIDIDGLRHKSTISRVRQVESDIDVTPWVLSGYRAYGYYIWSQGLYNQRTSLLSHVWGSLARRADTFFRLPFLSYHVI